MDKKIKIFTITAAYNNGKFFKDYLNSIVSQSVPPECVIYVDDASKDDSWQIVLDFFAISDKTSKFSIDLNKNTKFIGIQREKNYGCFSGRNLAIKEAIERGASVIQILDADDFLYPLKIEKGIIKLTSYSFASVIYSDYDMVYNDGTKKREFKEDFSWNKLRNECIISNNSMIPVSAIQKVGPYNENLRSASDYEYWLRLCSIGMGMHIAESLYSYRLHGQNITTLMSQNELGKEWQECHRSFGEWVKNGGEK